MKSSAQYRKKSKETPSIIAVKRTPRARVNLVRADEKIEMDQENTDQQDGAGHFTLADIRTQWSAGAGTLTEELAGVARVTSRTEPRLHDLAVGRLTRRGPPLPGPR